MTTRELLEHALLDALGLLDDDERTAFDTAFSAAPASIQAQVRREQTRIVQSEIALLPDAQPSASLRAAVVDAVRKARLGDVPVEHVSADSRVGSLAESQAPSSYPIRHRRLKAVSVWRAAALAFAAASVVFGWSTFQMYAEHERLVTAQRDDALFEALAEQFGRQFVIDAMVDADTQRYAFRTVSVENVTSAARAAVWRHPNWPTSRFFAVSLPPTAPGTTYRLAILDDQGKPVQDVLRFEFAGQLVNRELRLDITVENPVLGIVSTTDQGEDQVLLISSSDGSGV